LETLKNSTLQVILKIDRAYTAAVAEKVRKRIKKNRNSSLFQNKTMIEGGNMHHQSTHTAKNNSQIEMNLIAYSEENSLSLNKSAHNSNQMNTG
jgi:PBP1b-binding outer membrane lipoprotein LpoB